jgi:uncharacterized protein (DUF302 family)
MIRPFATLLVVLALLSAPLALADGHGLITKPSAHSVSVTLDRLEKGLTSKGITVALRWNHGAKAEGADIALRPTEILIFGNPKLGSHLMTSTQAAGIDLPLKALAWEDENGKVWLSYNDPAYLAERHGIEDRAEILAKMSKALAGLTDAATAP